MHDMNDRDEMLYGRTAGWIIDNVRPDSERQKDIRDSAFELDDLGGDTNRLTFLYWDRGETAWMDGLKVISVMPKRRG